MSAGPGEAATEPPEGAGPRGRDGGEAPRVVVTAATGYTGGLVAERLAASGLPFLLTARREDALEARARALGGVRTRVVDVTRPETLAACLRPGDVVINCAGPFTELGEPVVACCVGERAHYLDTTGEQPFMKRIDDRYDGPAREAGVAVVNGMAFEYALGDAAAALAARGLERPPERIDVVYRWRGEAASTPGTRASILRTVSRRGWALEDGRWRREPVARRRRRVLTADGKTRDAMSFPAGEVVTVPRHLDVETARGWMVAGRATVRIARLLSPVLAPAARLLEPLLDPLVRRGPEGPTAEQRRAGGFEIVAASAGPVDTRRAVAVRGRDPYGLTASLVVGAAEALLDREGREVSGGEQPPGGVLAPSELVDPAPLLDGLGRFDVTWREAPDAGPVA